MPASGRIRASSTSCVQSVRPRDGGSLEVRTWWTRPDSTEAGLRLTGARRPVWAVAVDRYENRTPRSCASSAPDTYELRPADRTDDYSAADFVISEALQ